MLCLMIVLYIILLSLSTQRDVLYKKIVTTRCVITQKSAVLSYFTVAPSNFWQQDGTSTTRLHSWCVRPTGPLPIIFYCWNFRPHALFSQYRFCYRYRNRYYIVFQLQPQLKVFIMPNIYSSTKSVTDQTIATTPPQNKFQHTTSYGHEVLQARMVGNC